MPSIQRLRGIVLATAIILAQPWPAAALEMAPGADLCAAINSMPEGGELALAPGDYQGPCKIRRGGAPGAPIVIRAARPDRRPRIVYSGRAANVFEIRAAHVTLRGLAFGPTQRNVDAVRIYGGGGVTVEDCEFAELGGIAVVANHGSVHGLIVRRNTIVDSGATAMYFGCHDGVSCLVSGLLVERNHIRRVRAPDPEIGYGIQVKLGSTAVIRGNVVEDTKGPGIMVYGSRDAAAASLIERNVVAGSLRSSGILVGGGPAVVRNNVALGSAGAGIALEDYQRRGLLRGVVVAHNTVHDNLGGGIVVPERGLAEAIIVNNAASAPAGAPALPAAHNGLVLAGNADCRSGGCFVDPARRDFSPAHGSALAAMGVRGAEPWMPADDFFGRRRPMPGSVGAVEPPGGPIPAGKLYTP